MTKAEVVSEIAEKTGIAKEEVTATVEAFFSVVKSNMADGKNIYVRGFGSFINKKRARKVARNISKNESMIVEAHYLPTFKACDTFKELVAKKVKVHPRMTNKEVEEKFYDTMKGGVK